MDRLPVDRLPVDRLPVESYRILNKPVAFENEAFGDPQGAIHWKTKHREILSPVSC